MSARINITGQRFGRLTVLQFSHTGRWGKAVWACRCDCAALISVSGEDLKSGNTASCGCLHRDRAAKLNFRHGRSGTSLHARWKEINSRCFNPKHARFADYGGRGITVCARWRTFENFFADMGEPPPGLMLDRIDNNGPYEPGNCRWTTAKVSNNNQRRHKNWKI